MKKVCICCVLTLLLLIAAACGKKEDPHPEWDASWIRLEPHLAAEPLEGFAVDEINDTLSLSGIFYLSLKSGEAVESTNASGEAAKVYGAQLYLLLQEKKSNEDAKRTVAGWMDRERENYETGDGEIMKIGDQSYHILPLQKGREGNPYNRGAAAFAVRGSLAISVELVGQPSWHGNAAALLTDFLGGLHFAEEE